jgi:hypothetical protein
MAELVTSPIAAKNPGTSPFALSAEGSGSDDDGEDLSTTKMAVEPETMTAAEPETAMTEDHSSPDAKNRRHRRNNSSVDEVLNNNQEEAESLGIQLNGPSGENAESDRQELPPLKGVPNTAVAATVGNASTEPVSDDVARVRRMFGSMWSKESFFPASPINAMIDDPGCTVESIMMEDDVFQEARRSNKKLVDYLLLPKNILKIIDYTVCEEDMTEEQGSDPASLLRYSYVSCALLCSDVGSITSALFEEIKDGDRDETVPVDPLERLFNCLFRDSLSPRVAGNFEKVVEGLLVSQRENLLLWLNEHEEYLPLFLRHIAENSVLEIFRKILHFADGGDINSTVDGIGMDLWRRARRQNGDESKKTGEDDVAQHPIIAELVGAMADGSQGPPMHTNVMEVLVDIVVRSTGEMTFMMMQRNQEPKNEPTRLMAALDQPGVSKALVEATVQGWDGVASDATRARLQILSRWLNWVSHNLMVAEIEKRQFADEEAAGAEPGPQSADPPMPPLVCALLEAFPFFCHALDADEKPEEPFPTTYGTATRRLGRVRIELVDLLCTVATVPHVDIAKAVASTGFMGMCFETMINFEWCNIVHAKITRAVVSMCNDVVNAVAPDVYYHFFIEYNILKRIIAVYKEDEEKRHVRHYASGYMGHVHVIAASIQETVKILREQGVQPGLTTPAQIVLQAVENNNALSEWSLFLDLTLSEVIRVQTKALGQAEPEVVAEQNDEYPTVD